MIGAPVWRKASGSKIEVVERMLDDKRILAHIRASAPNMAQFLLGDDESINATMTAPGALFEVRILMMIVPVLDNINSIGHMPLRVYRPSGRRR